MPANPFRCFNSSPEVIRLVVMMYVRFPLSLRNVEDLLFERGIDICHETVRFWWNRFGPLFAAEIRRQRQCRMRGFWHWRWHVDEGVPSCTEDEGMAPRSRPSGVGFKPLQAATVKSRGGERCRKGGLDSVR